MRITKEIEIEGKKAIALFDRSAVYEYVKKKLIGDCPKLVIPEPYKVTLGGRIIEVHELYLL